MEEISNKKYFVEIVELAAIDNGILNRNAREIPKNKYEKILKVLYEVE